MDTILDYFEFSDFFTDKSEAFSGNEIAIRALNETHFLIFEKENEQFNLYVSRYVHKKDVGKNKPEILELVVKNYKKSLPEHRIALRKYIE
ncbi:hypothetical protein [uncultured Polaribacter sp.]|uniref:hypothetical protein n=1 Tax=uncultured Polaribacter sp. TaxID=174711 RepID=UPI002628B1E2|nr:hypothetical protein [uncultured Polaribacter sp.]